MYVFIFLGRIFLHFLVLKIFTLDDESFPSVSNTSELNDGLGVSLFDRTALLWLQKAFDIFCAFDFNFSWYLWHGGGPKRKVIVS